MLKPVQVDPEPLLPRWRTSCQLNPMFLEFLHGHMWDPSYLIGIHAEEIHRYLCIVQTMCEPWQPKQVVDDSTALHERMNLYEFL